MNNTDATGHKLRAHFGVYRGIPTKTLVLKKGKAPRSLLSLVQKGLVSRDEQRQPTGTTLEFFRLTQSGREEWTA
jgi:predicted ArsR family transcriptional regulator